MHTVKILLSPFGACNLRTLCGSVFSFSLAVWLGLFFSNYKINVTGSGSKVSLCHILTGLVNICVW